MSTFEELPRGLRKLFGSYPLSGRDHGHDHFWNGVFALQPWQI